MRFFGAARFSFLHTQMMPFAMDWLIAVLCYVEVVGRVEEVEGRLLVVGK